MFELAHGRVSKARTLSRRMGPRIALEGDATCGRVGFRRRALATDFPRPIGWQALRAALRRGVCSREREKSEPMGTRLYVGNLSFSSTAESVREAFARIGEVTDVHIVTDRASGQSRGFGFVTMGSPAEAQKAIESMNGALARRSRAARQRGRRASGARRRRRGRLRWRWRRGAGAGAGAAARRGGGGGGGGGGGDHRRNRW